ncbi:MAG: DUF1127 domain-containing protein [Pseudomonadota bacterium]
MAHATTSTAHAPVFNPVTLITDQWARFQNWMRVKHTLEELSALSDRELNDLGLGRGDLYRVALDSVYGTGARS